MSKSLPKNLFKALIANLRPSSKLIDSLYSIADSVSKMAIGLKDPLQALEALSNYRNNFEIMRLEYNKIGINILRAGANYKQEDNGYFFYFGI